MTTRTAHILLLDGRIICLEIDQKTTYIALMKHICQTLRVKRGLETIGIYYYDSRGYKKWITQDSALIKEDVFSFGEVFQMVYSIRYIPHFIYPNEVNIYLLFLQASRLLRKKWFINLSNIHSQLFSLYILVYFGFDLSELQLSNICTDLSSKVEKSEIISAYQIYNNKLETKAEVILKFIHLANRCSVFTHQMFLVEFKKAEKCILGINSSSLVLFNIQSYHKPFLKIPVKDIKEVMTRGVKIVLALKTKSRFDPIMCNLRQSRSSNNLLMLGSQSDRNTNTMGFVDNDNNNINHSKHLQLTSGLVILVAMTTHQCNLICTNITHAIKYSESTINKDTTANNNPITIYRISDLMKNNSFIDRLNIWLDTELKEYNQNIQTLLQTPKATINNELVISLVHAPSLKPDEDEDQFKEIKFADTEFYESLELANTGDSSSAHHNPEDFYDGAGSSRHLTPGNTLTSSRKAGSTSNLNQSNQDQLQLEKERLQQALTIKLQELFDNFSVEKELTGKWNAQCYEYFPRGNIAPNFGSSTPRFVRNSKFNFNQSKLTHKNCVSNRFYKKSPLLLDQESSQSQYDKLSSNDERRPMKLQYLHPSSSVADLRQYDHIPVHSPKSDNRLFIRHTKSPTPRIGSSNRHKVNPCNVDSNPGGLHVTGRTMTSSSSDRRSRSSGSITSLELWNCSANGTTSSQEDLV